jgi:hypothetical protein
MDVKRPGRVVGEDELRHGTGRENMKRRRCPIGLFADFFQARVKTQKIIDRNFTFYMTCAIYFKIYDSIILFKQ